MNNILVKWLGCSGRKPCSYSEFEVVDVQQISKTTDEIEEYLAGLLREARFDKEFLEGIADYIGWERTKSEVIAPGFASSEAIRRGDLGEALFLSLAEEFHGYIVPVRKLRFKVRGNQTLPGTDVLAFKLDSDSITEVCFVESKLRTAPDNMAAVKGYQQLKNDYESMLPEMLSFVAYVLHMRWHKMFESMASNMR